MDVGSMTSFDKDISMEIKEDEDLLWRGVPQKASFVLSKSVQLLPIALIWLLFDGFGISMLISAHPPKGVMLFAIIFFAFHLMPVWFWIHSILTARKKHKLIEYAFTDKRIIVRNGAALKSYNYEDLKTVSVKVGLIDKLFKVGDISLSGQHSVVLLDIDNPYAVGKKLQQFINHFAEERKKHIRNSNCEYEEYVEHGNRGFSVVDLYDDLKNDRFAPKGRFTSKKTSAKADKTEEDEYLDNIMGSINKKDEF